MSGFASNVGSNLVANIASDGLSSNSLVASGVNSLFKMTPKGKFKVGNRALDDALKVLKAHDRHISEEDKQFLSRRIKNLWDERRKYPPHIHLLDIRTQLKIAPHAEKSMIACLKVLEDTQELSRDSLLDTYLKGSAPPPGEVPTTPQALDTSEGENSQAAATDSPVPVPRKRLPPPVPPRRVLNTSEGETVINGPTLVNDPPGPPPPPSPRTSPSTLKIPNSGSLQEPNVNASTSRASPSRRRPPLPPPPSPSKSPVYPPPAEPDFPEEDPFAG